ncbi:MAG: citrate synthase [Candidatus Obscuribacterales bacterium]|nr:MAG: citrate synthase [Candidatus Melainabacteria bacterium]
MVKAGLEDIVAASSSICDVNGKEGRLVYQGYDIHDLAEHSTYEETVFLLWNGRLPHKQELETLSAALRSNAAIPAEVVKAMKAFPKDANSMEVLRTAVSMLSMYDPDDELNDRDANVRKATRLTAQLPTIVAYWDNIRNGKEPVAPNPNLSVAANFLYLLHGGKEPDQLSTKSLDIALILHADHELNASTFAARVAAGTLTDIHSAIVAAIGTLKGPLHGGANQEVIKMLIKIDKLENVQPYISKMFEERKKVMGFGHRVYKTEDPRASHLRKMSEELGRTNNELKWFQMSRKIEEMVLNDKGFYANVDFYSASVYYMLGIPTDLFTPIFAVSRMAGWAAHVLEQYDNNRLIRPRADYTGPKNLTYVSIDKR